MPDFGVDLDRRGRSARGGDRKSLTVVIVAFNHPAELRDCLNSVERFNDIGDRLEVIVVDNSRSAHVRNVSSEFAGVRYVPNENVGFGGGCNRGAAVGSGELIGFLNPDTILIEPVFSFVARTMAVESDLGAMGVRLVSPAGKREQSFFWVDRGGVIKTLLQHLLCRLDIYLARSMCTSGAALFVRRSAFVSVRGFDSEMFLYNEEPDLWRRLRAAGWQWAYSPSRRLVHVGGSTTPSLGFNATQRLCSLEHYCRKYGINFRRRVAREWRYARFVHGVRAVFGLWADEERASRESVLEAYRVVRERIRSRPAKIHLEEPEVGVLERPHELDQWDI